MTEEKDDEQILKVDCIGRVKTPPEVREQLLDLFEQSGLLGTQFAARHGINYQTFATWAQKRRRSRGDYENLTQKKTIRKTPATSLSDEPANVTTAFPITLAEVVVEKEKSESSSEDSSVSENLPPALRIELPGGSVAFIADESQTSLVVGLIEKLSPKYSSPTSPPSC